MMEISSIFSLIPCNPSEYFTELVICSSAVLLMLGICEFPLVIKSISNVLVIFSNGLKDNMMLY